MRMSLRSTHGALSSPLLPVITSLNSLQLQIIFPSCIPAYECPGSGQSSTSLLFSCHRNHGHVSQPRYSQVTVCPANIKLCIFLFDFFFIYFCKFLALLNIELILWMLVYFQCYLDTYGYGNKVHGRELDQNAA